jgi:hypothetical protein
MVNKIQTANWLGELPRIVQNEIRESMHKIEDIFVGHEGVPANFFPGDAISRSPFVRNLLFSYITEIEFKGATVSRITLPTGAEKLDMGMRFVAHLDNFALMMRSPNPTAIDLLFSAYLSSGLSRSDLEAAGKLTAGAVLDATQSLPFSDIAAEYAADITDIEAKTIESIITALSQISEGGEISKMGASTLLDSIAQLTQLNDSDTKLIALFDTLAEDGRLLSNGVSLLAFNCASAIEQRGERSPDDAVLVALISTQDLSQEMLLINRISKELAAAITDVKAKTIESIIISLSQISEGDLATHWGTELLTESVNRVEENDGSEETLTTLFETLALETRLPEEILLVAGQLETALLNRGEASAVDAVLHALEATPESTTAEESAIDHTTPPLTQTDIENIAASIADRIDAVDASDVTAMIDSLAISLGDRGGAISTMETLYLTTAIFNKDTEPLDVAIALIAVDERIDKVRRDNAMAFLEHGKKDLKELLAKAEPEGGKDPEGGGSGSSTPPVNESPDGSSQGGQGSKLSSTAGMTSDGFGGFFAAELDMTSWGAEQMLESDQDPMSLGVTTMTGIKAVVTPIMLSQPGTAATARAVP